MSLASCAGGISAVCQVAAGPDQSEGARLTNLKDKYFSRGSRGSGDLSAWLDGDRKGLRTLSRSKPIGKSKEECNGEELDQTGSAE